MRLLTAVTCVLIAISGRTQILEPVKWTFTGKRLSATEAEVILKAKIDKGWHLYSQKAVNDGPIPTSFRFNTENHFELIGSTKESKAITKKEPVFDNQELSFFENSATFTQKIKLKNNESTIVSGSLEFMVCDESKCLPPESIDFTIPIEAFKENPSTAASPASDSTDRTFQKTDSIASPTPVKWLISCRFTEKNIAIFSAKAIIQEGWHIYSPSTDPSVGPKPTAIIFVPSEKYKLSGKLIESSPATEFDSVFGAQLSFYEGEAEFSQQIEVKDPSVKISGTIEYMACDDKQCTFPDPESFDVSIEALVATSSVTSSCSVNWSVFITGFLGGLLALLTPCVFPMLPLTVSFFTKQSKTRAKGISNAIIYGISIVVIYVLLGMGVTITFGADALNALSTNVWFNIAFFILLVIFAISFLGAFEITLPSSWINKADSASERGGLIGIFFMAFTLSLVSFSCTGPIIGTLLVDAAVNGCYKDPALGMFGFSLALALPFGLFAAFPGWLNTLPKSGGWLNSVKVVLGLLELALALKFLSNADLVVQAGLLTREVFIAVWIAIFSVLTLYLFGLIKFPHDSDLKYLSIPRVMFAIVSLFFTIYLIPGMWGAPLKLVSGFPPPMFYSESPNGVGSAAAISSVSSEKDSTAVGEPEHCPHNLNCFHDYDEGLAYARKSGKPVMIDFTGWACVNCRKMEEQVWSDPGVLKLLREDVVLISLYVDEKTELPENEQTEVEIGGKKKKIKTIGNKWSYMQASRYQTNSQPYYVMVDHNENTLSNGSAAYDPDITKFEDWLKKGIEDFKK